MDDNSLMAQVIEGEIDKMGILYERYKMPLYAYFFKITGADAQSAEDLVHTVFYRAICYKTSFRGRGSFVKWLFRIAHNVGIDHYKKTRFKDNNEIESHRIQAVLYENNDVEKNEERATLERAMGMLKSHERELIILGKIECLKYREIAGIFNTTEGNIKIQIFRILKKLKDIYSKLESIRYEKAGS